MKTRNLRTLLGLLALAAAGAGAFAATGAGQTTTNALVAHRFHLTADGVELATFNRLQGITAEVEPVEYMEAGDDSPTYSRMVGRAKPPQIVLKRPASRTLELSSWHEQVRNGTSDARKSVTLRMVDTQGKPIARWHLENAWPSKLEVTGTHTSSGEALHETVTLTAEYIQRVSP